MYICKKKKKTCTHIYAYVTLSDPGYSKFQHLSCLCPLDGRRTAHCIGVEFKEFSRNNKYIMVAQKLSEKHFKVPLFSNPGDKALKCVKSSGQILYCIWNILTLECISDSFPGILRYLLFRENCRNCSPLCIFLSIQGSKSLLVLKFYVTRI